MPNTVFIFVAALVIVLLVLRLLRNRTLREKYAALWILVGTFTVVLAAFPWLLDTLAHALGFELGSNLLFALAIILLLGVALHLSLEISRLEDETRVLAEEAAISRTALGRLQQRLIEMESPVVPSQENAPPRGGSAVRVDHDEQSVSSVLDRERNRAELPFRDPRP